MEELEALRSRLAQQRPAAYAALPDIELYKDQVLTYMLRQQPGGESESPRPLRRKRKWW